MRVEEFTELLTTDVKAFENYMNKEHPTLELLTEEEWYDQFIAFLSLGEGE